MKQCQLKEAGFEAEKMEGLKYILDTLKVIIAQERRVLAAAQEAEDEVTVALMDDYLTGQEKNVWMLVATLSEASVTNERKAFACSPCKSLFFL